MEHFNNLSILFYCIFSFFAFYQQKHADSFRGSSQVFYLVLGAYTFFSFITGLIYMIYYSYEIVWYAFVVIFIISILSKVLLFKIEKVTGMGLLSLIGFIAIPIFGFLMFKYFPLPLDE